VIICTKCGFQNADETSFCGSCGSFLEWTGQKIGAAGASAGSGSGSGAGVDTSAATGTATADGPATDGTPSKGPTPLASRIARAQQTTSFTPTAADPPGTAAARPASPPWMPADKVESTRPHAGRQTPAAPPPTAQSAPATQDAAAATPAGTSTAAAPWMSGPVPAATASTEPAAVVPKVAQPESVKPWAIQPEAVQPEAVQPGAVQPGAAQPEAVTPGAFRPVVAQEFVAEPEPTPLPGQIVCSECRMVNDAARRFCKRCGALLVREAPPVPRLPRWRRLWNSIFHRRTAAAAAAGTRPLSLRDQAAESAGGGRGIGRLIVVVLGVAIVASVAAYAFVPSVHDGVSNLANQVRIAFRPNYVPVNTAGEATGPAVSDHPASMAFDGYANTYWSAPDGADQPTITAHFSPPANIAKVLITPGAYGDFQGEPRPHQVKLTFKDSAGKVIYSNTFDLTDSKDFETLDVDVTRASTVELTVLSSYQSVKGAEVSIIEVEFRERQ
jgi:hypothetical protein